MFLKKEDEMKQKPKQPEQFEKYTLIIEKWSTGYSRSNIEDEDIEEYIHLELEVKLTKPVEQIG
jgi:hypothetical protein